MRWGKSTLQVISRRLDRPRPSKGLTPSRARCRVIQPELVGQSGLFLISVSFSPLFCRSCPCSSARIATNWNRLSEWPKHRCSYRPAKHILLQRPLIMSCHPVWALQFSDRGHHPAVLSFPELRFNISHRTPFSRPLTMFTH